MQFSLSAAIGQLIFVGGWVLLLIGIFVFFKTIRNMNAKIDTLHSKIDTLHKKLDELK